MGPVAASLKLKTLNDSPNYSGKVSLTDVRPDIIHTIRVSVCLSFEHSQEKLRLDYLNKSSHHKQFK